MITANGSIRLKGRRVLYLLAIYTRTKFINGSNEYKAGRLPEASSTVCRIPSSNNDLVNRAAVAAGIQLFEVNLLLRNTGLVKTKSSAVTLHFEDNIPEKSCFIFS